MLHLLVTNPNFAIHERVRAASVGAIDCDTVSGRLLRCGPKTPDLCLQTLTIRRMNLLLWTKRFIGVCCVSFFLLFVWLLIGTIHGILYDPYVAINIIIIMLLASFASGTLLFGTAGLSLLTGKYHKHKQTLHRIWLVLGALTFFLFLLAFGASVPVP